MGERQRLSSSDAEANDAVQAGETALTPIVTIHGTIAASGLAIRQ